MDYQILLICFFILLVVSFESYDKKYKYTEADINRNFQIDNYENNYSGRYNGLNPNWKMDDSRKNPFSQCSAKTLKFIETEHQTEKYVLAKQPGRIRECVEFY